MRAKNRLIVVVPQEWWEKEEIKELEKKGHTIIPPTPEIDLYLGPNCHYWVEEMFGEGYLEMAVKRVNKIRKEKEVDDTDKSKAS